MSEMETFKHRKQFAKGPETNIPAETARTSNQGLIIGMAGNHSNVPTHWTSGGSADTVLLKAQ